ncbi:unnamed protein product [Linum trigynum]|uniref:Uncharacterized protein n=1 Tax=Linum trigynum TaxID=586398 RepID=A0AAV2DUY8_9ROSI
MVGEETTVSAPGSHTNRLIGNSPPRRDETTGRMTVPKRVAELGWTNSHREGTSWLMLKTADQEAEHEIGAAPRAIAEARATSEMGKPLVCWTTTEEDARKKMTETVVAASAIEKKEESETRLGSPPREEVPVREPLVEYEPEVEMVDREDSPEMQVARMSRPAPVGVTTELKTPAAESGKLLTKLESPEHESKMVSRIGLLAGCRASSSPPREEGPEKKGDSPTEKKLVVSRSPVDPPTRKGWKLGRTKGGGCSDPSPATVGRMTQMESRPLGRVIWAICSKDSTKVGVGQGQGFAKLHQVSWAKKELEAGQQGGGKLGASWAV